MSTPIIRVTGLVKRFGDFTAVDALDFAVAPGSIFAFLGANGSGKSTTIRMLIGLLTPTAGTIEVDGIDVIRTPRRVRDHIGYMGQKVSLYQGLSLRENLEFYAGLYGLQGRDLETRWGELRERFELADVEHEKASELPAGVRQRAGLALSILHRPRVLFLDEPTAGVDLHNRLLFWDRIRAEAAAGVTVFVTTHFLEEVEYCDWTCFIDAGRLIANAHPAEIRRRFSDGYRLRIALPPEARAAAARALGATGGAVATEDGTLVLRTPTLSAPVLDAAGRIAAAHPDAPIAIERPEMSDVFRRLMREAQAHPAAAAAYGAPLLAERPETGSTSAPPQIRLTEASNALRARARRLRALLIRESRATLRDPFTVTILIAVPLAALMAFSLTLSTEVRNLTLGLLDANRTAASRRLAADLAANGTFAIRPYATRDAVDRALVAGEISVAVVVPPDFDRRLETARPGAEPPSLHVLYDGGETVVAGNAEAFLLGLVNATGVDLRARRGPPSDGAGERGGGGVRVVARALFNPTLDGTPFMVAGTYGFVLTFLTTLITAVSVVNERVGGTFEQLQVTPASASEIVLGKILPLGAVFTADVVLMVLAAGLVLGVWPAGNAFFFVLATAGYVLVSLSTGVILSATSGTPAEAVQKTVLSSIPLIFLGGFVFPIRNMPIGFQWISEAIPATHYIRIARAIYLRAAGPFELATELLLVGVFGAALITVAFRAVGARA
ncbi:MAG: ABC transporter ATP-binding protein/permease [Deltaproteobacteria bacterium]|nr:ABC transporter ATP-binding protein/permease [Deltaproteobacteria bacterium]